MENTVTHGVRKLFFLIVALYAGYCALCWLITAARLGNIAPAGLHLMIVVTNVIGCLALTVLNLLEIGLLAISLPPVWERLWDSVRACVPS
jgi:hypothetical protein